MTGVSTSTAIAASTATSFSPVRSRVAGTIIAVALYLHNMSIRMSGAKKYPPGATPWTMTFCASSATHGGSKLSHSNLPQTDGDSLLDFTWVNSVPDAAQQPSKPHIGLGEKGFQTPHDEGQILWTEGDMELWLKLYQLLFCISLGQKDFRQVVENMEVVISIVSSLYFCFLKLQVFHIYWRSSKCHPFAAVICSQRTLLLYIIFISSPAT